MVAAGLIALASCAESTSTESAGPVETTAPAETTAPVETTAPAETTTATEIDATDAGGESIDFGATPLTVAYCGSPEPGVDRSVVTVLHGSDAMVGAYLDFLTGNDPDRLDRLDEAEVGSFVMVQAVEAGIVVGETEALDSSYRDDWQSRVFMLDADVAAGERPGEYASVGELSSGTILFSEVSCEPGSNVVVEIDVTLDSELLSDARADASGTLIAEVVDGAG